jgi:acyl-CoA thioesterase-2
MSTPGENHDVTPISTPSPPIFLSPQLTREGIYKDLITTIKPSQIDPERRLKVEEKPADQTWFVAKHPTYPSWGRTYGGVFISQAMAVGLLSLNDPSQFYVHQLQSIFVRGGKEGSDIEWRVKQIKVTKAFINSHAEAFQDGKLLYTALLSFITPNEPNSVSHTVSPYKLDPSALPNPDDIPLYNHDLYNLTRDVQIMKDPVRQKMILGQTLVMPVTTKLINRDYADIKYWAGKNIPREPRQLLYVRMPISAKKLFGIDGEIEAKFPNNDIITPKNDEKSDEKDPINKVLKHVSLINQLNMLALAYASDYNVIPMLLRPHNLDVFPLNVQFSSLNHNITFFSPEIDIFDDWLIFDTSAPFYQNSRSQLVGTFYTRSGKVVAHVTQETLGRVFEGDVIDKFPNPMQVGVKMAEKSKAKHGGKNVGSFGVVLDRDQNKARL